MGNSETGLLTIAKRTPHRLGMRFMNERGQGRISGLGIKGSFSWKVVEIGRKNQVLVVKFFIDSLCI